METKVLNFAARYVNHLLVLCVLLAPFAITVAYEKQKAVEIARIDQ